MRSDLSQRGPGHITDDRRADPRHPVPGEQIAALGVECGGTRSERDARQRARTAEESEIVVDGLIERLRRGALLSFQCKQALLSGTQDDLMRLEVMLEGCAMHLPGPWAFMFRIPISR